MTSLSIYNQEGTVLAFDIHDYQDIVSKLSDIGVEFERWNANIPLTQDATSDMVLNAYQEDITKINQRYGFQSVDVVSVYPEHPQRIEFREKFLAEHTHSDFEVRFFVEGEAVFYLHYGDRVYLVLCAQGDLISVPAHTPHWFDMGESPNFKAIRFFSTSDGWIANFTGSDIATKFPTFDLYNSKRSL